PRHRHGQGFTFNAPSKLREIVAVSVEAGFSMHFHAVGDRTASDCIDALEAAEAVSAVKGLRHQIAHLQVVRPADIERMARLGIIANVQPASLCADDETRGLLLEGLGRKRYEAQYPL